MLPNPSTYDAPGERQLRNESVTLGFEVGLNRLQSLDRKLPGRSGLAQAPSRLNPGPSTFGGEDVL